jgi:hypothetical protein
LDGQGRRLAAASLPRWRASLNCADRLESTILSTISETRVEWGNDASKSPNTTNIGFAAMEGDAILLCYLSEQGNLRQRRAPRAAAEASSRRTSCAPSGIPHALRAHGAIRFQPDRDIRRMRKNRSATLASAAPASSARVCGAAAARGRAVAHVHCASLQISRPRIS